MPAHAVQTGRPGPSAAPYVPADRRVSLRQLASSVQDCRGCELYENGTHAVFGEGPSRAAIMLVGEQPGDREEIEGQPFVGPSGRVLDEALELAGVERDAVYVTNAVKHFRFEQRGKRRLHKKPTIEHVRACAPWLEAEAARLRPQVAVAMGATAAQAMLGAAFRVTRDRGRAIGGTPWAAHVVATVHPASIVRISERPRRKRELLAFVDDLRVAAALVDHG